MTSMERYGDTFFQQGQIRLAELSVYNWGSFEGLHTARIADISENGKRISLPVQF